MTDAPESRGPARGESDVTLQVHETEDDEEVTYLPADDEVRFVGGYRHTKPPSELEPGEPLTREPFYTTTPAERWGTTRCVEAAAKAAAEHVSEVLDTEDVTWAISGRLEGRDRVAEVEITTILRRDGSVDVTPDVDFDSVVAATPHSVSASYELDDFAFELDVPIYARHAVIRNE